MVITVFRTVTPVSESCNYLQDIYELLEGSYNCPEDSYITVLKAVKSVADIYALRTVVLVLKTVNCP